MGGWEEGRRRDVGRVGEKQGGWVCVLEGDNRRDGRGWREKGWMGSVGEEG